jgi:Toprim domain
MTGSITLDDIEHLTAGRFGTIDASCPICSPFKSTSGQRRKVLRIWRDDPDFASYYCARCGTRGFAHDRRSVAPDPAKMAAARARAETARVDYEAKKAANRDRALSLWNEAQPIDGTLAATYLDRRGVLDVALAVGGDVIRFHPRCPFRDEGFFPALIALCRDIGSNASCAIRRTALAPDGRKRPLFCAADGRLTLGPTKGTAVKITADEDVAEGLTIAEGVETALAAIVDGFRPMWALGDAGGIADFPVLAGIEALIIVVDHDENGTGQNVARKCSARWTAAGREVLRVVSKYTDRDFNDIISERKTA